jgi:PAS domain S-box-containing protein
MFFRKVSPLGRFLTVGLILLGVFLAAGIYSFVRLIAANAGLGQNDEVRLAIHRLRSGIVDADTAMRAYVATGDPRRPAVFEAAVRRWREDLSTVQRVMGDAPAQRVRWTRVSEASGRTVRAFGRVRRAHDEGRSPDEQLALVLSAEEEMDAVRAAVDDMQSEEIRVGSEKLAETNTSARRALVFLGGDALACLIVVGALWVRRRAATEQQRVEGLLELAHDAIIIWDRDGRIRYWNRGAEESYGWTAEEAIGQRVNDLLATQFPVVPLEQIQAEVNRVGHWSGELLHRRKDGSIGIAESRWARERPGSHGRTVEICRDVTARRQATELERSRTQFLLRAADELGASLAYEEILATVAKLAVPALADWCAVDVIEDGAVRRVTTVHGDPEKVAVADELNRRYGANVRARPGAPDIINTGRPVLIEEIAHEAIAAAAIDEDHLRLIEQLGLRSYLGVPLTARGKTIGALSFAMAESGRSFSQSDLAFARSLADRAALAIENGRLFREVERARAAASYRLSEETHRRQLAEETARFGEMFIGMLGHDLRNPLNAVMMSARLLERRGTGDPKAIERILASTARMSTMVRQLLDLTRSRLAGGIPMDKTELDVSALVSEVVDEARRADPHRAIDWRAPGSVPAELDHSRIAQVLSNLIGNALEHGDPAQPVDVTLVSGEHAFEICVHNRGAPIPPELLRIIFDPFRRTTARERGSRGLGLGLFISQQIVIAHGGRIEVRSTAEEGTTFTVRLPRAEPLRPAPVGQGAVA